MPVFSALDIYEDWVPRSAPVNMSMDEALWESAKIPCLRFYRWDHAALSFGYFGRYEEVAGYESKFELVRRCTGGGIVFHGTDLTYCLVIPSSNRSVNGSPIEIYGIVHEAIKNALAETGIAATLVDSSRPRAGAASTITDACFANPVRWDVLVNGIKVAGAAQRRSRRGLLQQGSIQQVEFGDNFQQKLVGQLAADPVKRTLDESILTRAGQLEKQKYATRAWLRRR